MSDLIEHLDDGNFQEKIKGAPILVDFFAEWCGPCRMLGPILEQVAKDLAGKVRVAKLDIDDNQGTASQYKVTSVPTVILFHNGKEVDRLVGLRDVAGIKKFLSSVI